jgi:Electron transfer DM13
VSVNVAALLRIEMIWQHSLLGGPYTLGTAPLRRSLPKIFDDHCLACNQSESGSIVDIVVCWCAAFCVQKRALHIPTTDIEQRAPKIVSSRRHKMKKWKVVIPVAVIALLVVWYAFRPERLVVNRSVHEEFPTTEAGSRPQALASGTFHGVLHPTEGIATIYRVGDGSRVLRFTNFKTSNGPDVHVYMVAADDAKDSASVERDGFLDLGTIKGNLGDQNYTLQPDVDLSKYRAVSVWCKRFSVNFGTAPLTPDDAMSRN